MSLLSSPLDKYKPTALSIKDVHKHLGKRLISKSEQAIATKALHAAGFESQYIQEALNDHRKLPLSELHKITTTLQQARVGAFGKISDPKQALQKVIHQETVKNRNIARIRGEYMHDALMEQLSDSPTGSPKPSTSKPKSMKLGF